jgi:Ni/Fe-hydrogenase 1 B-type cytochrome subunit
MRMVHFMAGYVFTIGFLVRIYWAVVGNKYSRELFYLPVWSGKWWGELFGEIKFYLFLSRKAPQTEAHNALAQSAMWLFNTVLGLFMIGTGFALYSENLGLGSWADSWFGWIIPALGGAQNTRMSHDFGMWLFIMFAIIHIYMAFRAEYMGRQSSLRTMVNGWRTYRD